MTEGHPATEDVVSALEEDFERRLTSQLKQTPNCKTCGLRHHRFQPCPEPGGEA